MLELCVAQQTKALAHGRMDERCMKRPSHPPAHHRHQLRRRPGQVACAPVVGQAQRLDTARLSADAGDRAVGLHVDGPRRVKAGLPVDRLGDALHPGKTRLEGGDYGVDVGNPGVSFAQVANPAPGARPGIVAEPCSFWGGGGRGCKGEADKPA